MLEGGKSGPWTTIVIFGNPVQPESRIHVSSNNVEGWCIKELLFVLDDGRANNVAKVVHGVNGALFGHVRAARAFTQHSCHNKACV